MKRSFFALPLLLIACGSLTDPTKSTVAKVSGALTTSRVPAGAHVALVWRVGDSGKFAVGSDAELVDGKFSIALDPPPDRYLYEADEVSYDELSSADSPPASGYAGDDQTTSNVGTRTLAPRDNVSGGIAEPLKVAVAGFVVYVDANGNGKLDLKGTTATSEDTIVGGNRELYLAYLSGGGALAYEKLRDNAGQLPHGGFNVAWAEKSRWLPLDVVELELDDGVSLPDSVCGDGGGTATSTPTSEPAIPTTVTGGMNGYPAASDPFVVCLDEGRTFEYARSSCSGTVSDATPSGLCSPAYSSAPDACRVLGESLPKGAPVPKGWPCPLTAEADASAP